MGAFVSFVYMTNQISVANVILAILWRRHNGTVKSFRDHDYFRFFCAKKSKKTVFSSISRLKKQGFIETKGRYNILLTQAGIEKALHAFVDAETILYIQKKHRWDGGWRIVFFDIPESKRRFRDYLRKVIKKIGFKELQRSVWIYPGQVPTFLKHVLFENDLKKYVRFITTESIDNDQDLKKMFNIKGYP